MTSAASVNGTVEEQLGHIRAAVKIEPNWLVILNRYQVPRSDARSELALVVRGLAHWASHQLSSLPEQAQAQPDCIALRQRLQQLETTELARYDASLPAASAAGGLAGIFANAASTGKRAQAMHSYERVAQLVCPQCGAAQEHIKLFACPFCGHSFSEKEPQ